VSKRDDKKTPLSRAERVMTRNSHGRAAEVSKISWRGRGRARLKNKILLEGEPVEHIKHIAGNIAKFGDVPREACRSAQDPV